LQVDLWNIDSSRPPRIVASSVPDPGEATVEKVVFEDITGNGQAELLAIAWSDEGYGVPLLFQVVDTVLEDVLRRDFEGEYEDIQGPNRIRLVRNDEGRLCAFGLPKRGGGRLWIGWFRDSFRASSSSDELCR
jgi:hypothetical protein